MTTSLETFAFYWPWLATLLPLPLLAYYFLKAAPKVSEDGNKAIINFPHLQRLKRSFQPHSISSNASNRLFVILLSILWMSLVLAVMRPVYTSRLTQVEVKGHDIMLAIDLSGSMRALDFSTATERRTRLQVAKEVIAKFAEKRTTDRLGLVLFGEHAYLQVPMTRDQQSVIKMLQNAEPGMAGLSTSIGDAIGLAAQELRSRHDASRILVLLTDGEDTSSHLPPRDATRIAAKLGIKIYVVGIGRNGPVPIADEYGRIFSGEAPLDEELLQFIAQQTGGRYYKAENVEVLEQIYQQIDALEKIDLEAEEFQISEPLYRYPLSLAMIALLLIALLPLSNILQRRQL